MRFKTNEYASMSAAYAEHQRPKSGRSRKAAERPATSSSTAPAAAVETASRPAARGRWRFSGCARSRSRSMMSLTM